jgi:chromosome segregation ATPase
MRNSCLSYLKQGWFGLPLFFLGLGSLAFSQLETDSSSQNSTAAELASSIDSKIRKGEELATNLRKEISLSSQNQISSIEQKISSKELSKEDKGILRAQFDNLVSRYKNRENSMNDSISQTEERVSSAKEIFGDIQSNFAGRLEEARPALLAVSENLDGSLVELEALSTMSSGLVKDFSYEVSSLDSQAEASFAQRLPSPPNATSKTVPVTSVGRKISSVIQAREALPLRHSGMIGKKVELSEPKDFGSFASASYQDEDGMIAQLRKELDDSKNFQSELSVDSAELKSDLRKAYREIVSLQTNLKESQLIINELENSKKSLYRNAEGGPATAQSVSKEINRLERELEQAREDLRQSRQSLLLEQQRSNAMISSITTELERTRRELDYARQMAHSNGANFERLAFLERELAQAKRALESTQQEPIEPGTDEFVNLQEELRKSLGEIARMQIELSEKDQMQEELLRLKSTMEQLDETPSRSASPAFVNKLLVELNAANDEIERLQKGNLADREGLSADVITLQDQLQATQTELDQVRREFADTKEDIAKREFEFATTIKKLEEEAQMAESVLQQAADGKLPMVPFVTEMEEDLAASESRIRLLSDQFANEQKRATDVIDELTNELELAQARNKQALDQLARRELEITNKDQEVVSLAQQKKDLEEELEVVKVIAGQLQDLNQVLEDTKETQVVQSQTSDQVVGSLKDELNRAKIELVVALEEKEKMQDEFSNRLNNLEMQLEDARNEMFEEQETFQETTSESKILVSELKSELEAARAEIAQMKKTGFSESVETKQAVAQLQEALGTIRILQESLQEAEAANLEVDNLRSELADTMSGQLAKFEEVEGEKNKLKDEILNLETEISLLRESNSGAQVAQLKSSSDLQSQLEASNQEISALRKRLSQSEELGVGSLVEMEDELAQLKNENDELRIALQEGTPSDKLLEELQNELASANMKLDNLRSSDGSVDEVAALQAQNSQLKKKLTEWQSRRNESDDNSALSSDSSLLEKAMDLEMKLEMALSKIEDMEGIENSPNDPKIASLEEELSLANSTIEQLNSQIENMISKQAEAELEMAMLENASGVSTPDSISADEKAMFIEEIESLRNELAAAKKEYSQTSAKSPEMASLQDELRQAVADSFELQMELEQTQERLKKMEETASLDPSQDSIADITRRANEAQDRAQSRIDELTNALRNSEQLRAETEDLVTALEQRVQQGGDISNDPRFVELQQEMLALQSDLISIQEMADPRVKELEDKLRSSRDEGTRLNEELQGVMNEFSGLKRSLNTLEDENRRLRDVSLDSARNQANEAVEGMQQEINRLARENANLQNQVTEKDSRIRGLRDELAQTSAVSSNDTSRNQILQLQMQLQNAEDTSSQAKMETQRLREELEFANRNLISLQERLRSMESGLVPNQPSISSVQLDEIEELKSQNLLLKEQIATLSSVPGKDQLEDRIKDLNQRNLALTVELDQERIIIDDLKNELSDARSIRQEVLERGKASKLKADLLNEELGDAKNRIQSLEKALVAAREAIRVLQGGGNRGSMIQVSNPSNFSTNLDSIVDQPRSSSSISYGNTRRTELPEYSPTRPRDILPRSSAPVSIKNEEGGSANLQIQAKVQFLDNKIRPAGFTEFFLVDRDLSEILSEEGIKPPTQQGILSHAEYWARSVQRGYQFPGVAAKIRNALARSSLRRIKTNSLGVGNVDALADGQYYIVGASTLGQVGVVWSKPVNLNNGDNILNLDLKDAAWAQ